MTSFPPIAHYRIRAKLGEGGMGAVYRATDTRLNRDVAIKVLPESFANDPDRLARFTREAQVLASLNHPNIAAIYGVEDRAIVMELVEGNPPAGPLTAEEALPLIHQLIDALEYAHERGVVHRDLKPANLKVTPEGRLKVLDFGLAKALSADSAPGGASEAANSPTLTMRATMAGVIMGTAGYMSPEQARGLAVDKRADIWSFGVIVHELLTGRQLFACETVTDTLAAVLTRDPDLSAVPQRFHRLLRLCLTRDPRQRLRDITGARLLIEESPPAPESARAASRLAWAIAGVMACAAVTAGVIATRAPGAAMHPMTSLPIDLSDEGSPDSVAISPDGRHLAYVLHQNGGQNLAIRSLDQTKGRIVPGSQRASFPFFSPDGQWVGFFGLAGLAKVRVEGGPVMTVTPLTTGPFYVGGAWGPDGSIVYAAGSGSGLWRVPAAGGEPKLLTDPGREGQATHRWPQFLPGGEAVLFTARRINAGFDDAEIDVLNLQTGQWKVVQKGGYYGRYWSSGHLLYVHQGTLFAVRLNPDRQETSGQPVPVMTEVAANSSTGEGRFDCSSDPSTSGLCLVWNGVQPNQVYNATWIEESGKATAVFAKPETYLTPKLSPDGRLLAIASGAPTTDVHIWDSARETLTQLTFDHSGNLFPIWTPDGRHLVYSSNANAIWWIRSDGGGAPHKLYEGPGRLVPCSFSPDGRRLAYFTLGAASEIRQNLWTLPIDTTDPEHPKAGEPQPFLATPNGETSPIFSLDGRWIAYNSDESGADEVYVRPFPGPGPKVLISTGGGRWAAWAADGKRLFYMNRGRIMVLEYSAKGSAFTAGKPRVWTDSSGVIQRTTSTFRNWDMSADGRRAIILTESEHAPQTTMRLSALFSFFDELKRRVP